jgi:uncharacterized Rmd1/YagE family protein
MFKHTYEPDMLKYLFTAKNNILLSSSFFKAYPPEFFWENPPLSSFFSNDRSHARSKVFFVVLF